MAGLWDHRFLDFNVRARSSRFGVMSRSKKSSSGEMMGPHAEVLLSHVLKHVVSECFATALLTDGPRDAVHIAVESTRSVFDRVIGLCECLDPPGNDSARPLERLELFQGVVPEVLESSYDS